MSQNIFLNPIVSSLPQLTPGSVGTGTLTVDKLSHFTVTQDYTAVCTATDPFTVFDIIGSLDGPVGVAIVGTQFTDQDNKLFLTINQGPILFEVGDTFEFSVEQGTDLTQENIDTYDELPQKNFGVGIIGQNAGDHNLRFNQAALLALREIQDLRYTSKVAGALGNSISIEYIEGSILTPAVLTIQDLTYNANLPGLGGNDIQIEYLDFIPDVKASRTIQDIAYTSKLEGTLGNVTSIEYVGGGTAGSEVATLISDKIQVTIEDGVSTADQVRTAIGSNPATLALVDGISTGTGLEAQSVQTELFLLNGQDAIGDAGNEVVTVLSNLIQIRFESGVSTAQQVYDAALGSPAALALITPIISGTAATAQTAPVAATNLAGGADNVGEPGNEIVEVVNNEIKVTFAPSLSTAAQIKAAVEAFAAADALVTVDLIGPGLQEIHDLIALAESDIDNGESFEVNDALDARTARFYYRIDGVDAPPGSGDDIPIDIATGDDANTVAIKSAATINAQPEWEVPTPPGSTFRITNALVGESSGVSNVDVGAGQSATFTITQIQDGFSIGEELQTSPLARTFLGGGLATGTYAFNTQEITDSGNFYEGNAGILVTGINNQGDETTQGETLKRGKVTLDDDEPSNNSGPAIENTQKTINAMIQNDKIMVETVDNSPLSWDAGTNQLSFSADLAIIMPDTGIVNTISSSLSPITLPVGESLYVILDRLNPASLSVSVGLNPPQSDDVFVLAYRNGSDLLWRGNNLQRDGQEKAIGSSPAFRDPKFTLSLADITNQYIDLPDLADQPSVNVSPKGGNIQEEDVDYSLSVVGGVTRVTFLGDLLARLEENDLLIVKYAVS